MAKQTRSSNLKGLLKIDCDLGEMRIYEITKEDEKVFSLSDILASYDDQFVTISIKQDDEIEPLEE